MKIRKFNEYLNLPMADLYHEINRVTQTSTGLYEPFSGNEIRILKKALPEYEYSNSNFSGVIWFLDKREGIESGRFPEAITIRKIRDEWFEISQGSCDSKIYKCDQIEGLLQCINRNFNNPPMLSSLKRGDVVNIKSEYDIKSLRIPSYQNLSYEDRDNISKYFGQTARIVNYTYRPFNNGTAKIGSDSYFDYIIDIDNGDFWWTEDYFE